jgi:chemotaxis protein methyltransferase CheR
MNTISDAEFFQFQRFIYDTVGISLSNAKKGLVSSRLARRLRPCGVGSYGEYFSLLQGGESPSELQTAIDLLTTNETYFFREPKHFEFLRHQLASPAALPRAPRIWSAASSSGEEAYSIAMVLQDARPGQPWDLLGSDISARVLERARHGHYSTARTQNIPPAYLRRFCLKGQGSQAGTLLVERDLRSMVRFMQINLNAPLPSIGSFDVIFLRNVLIYFDADIKRKVVARVLGALRPGGWLLIGHSESLAGVDHSLRAAAPSIFRKTP